MQKDKKVTVDGREYIVKYLQTSEANKIQFKLAKLLVPSLGKLLGETFSAEKDVQISEISFLDNPLNIDSALTFLGEHAGEAEIMEIIYKLASCAFFSDGTAIPFETHWMGETMHEFNVLREVMVHNYADFFGVLAGFGKKVLRPAARTSIPASAESTPRSGE